MKAEASVTKAKRIAALLLVFAGVLTALATAKAQTSSGIALTLADSARIAYVNCRANQRAHFVKVGLGQGQSLMANVRGPAEERPGEPKGYHLSFGENPLINQGWYILTLATEIALLEREKPIDQYARDLSLRELECALRALIRLDAALPPAGDGLLARHDLSLSVLEDWRASGKDSLIEASGKLVNLRVAGKKEVENWLPAFSQDDLLHLMLGLLATKELVRDLSIQVLVKQITTALYQNLAQVRQAVKAEPIGKGRVAEVWLRGAMLLLENPAIASDSTKPPVLAIGGAVGGFRPVLEVAFSTLLDSTVAFPSFLEIRKFAGLPLLSHLTSSRVETKELDIIWRNELPTGSLNLTYKLASKVLAKTLWRNKRLLLRYSPAAVGIAAFGGFGLALAGRTLHQLVLRPVFEDNVFRAIYAEDGGHLLMTAGVLEGTWEAKDFYSVDYLSLPRTDQNRRIPSRAHAYVLLNELLNSKSQKNSSRPKLGLSDYQELLRGMPLDGRPAVLNKGELKGADWAAKHRWVFWNDPKRGNMRDPGERNGVAYTAYYNLVKMLEPKTTR